MVGKQLVADADTVVAVVVDFDFFPKGERKYQSKIKNQNHNPLTKLH